MVRHLNGSLLPPNFRAFPQIHLGPLVEADGATLERLVVRDASIPDDAGLANRGTAAAWSPPEAVQTLDVEVPGQDVFELRVCELRPSLRLAAVVELVSPGNKDRPEERQSMAAKCASYLQEQVGVVLLDIVTTRRASIHQGLMQLLSVPAAEVSDANLYCVSYRNRRAGKRWRLETWPFPLAVGAGLPTTVPRWLAGAA
jgi:hypothetical protein